MLRTTVRREAVAAHAAPRTQGEPRMLWSNMTCGSMGRAAGGAPAADDGGAVLREAEEEELLAHEHAVGRLRRRGGRAGGR